MSVSSTIYVITLLVATIGTFTKSHVKFLAPLLEIIHLISLTIKSNFNLNFFLHKLTLNFLCFRLHKAKLKETYTNGESVILMTNPSSIC